MALPLYPSRTDTYSAPSCFWIPTENPQRLGKVAFAPHFMSPAAIHCGPVKAFTAARMPAPSVAPPFMNWATVMKVANVGPLNPVYSRSSMPSVSAHAKTASL